MRRTGIKGASFLCLFKRIKVNYPSITYLWNLFKYKGLHCVVINIVYK